MLEGDVIKGKGQRVDFWWAILSERFFAQVQ